MAKHPCIQRVARGTERALSVIADAIRKPSGSLNAVGLLQPKLDKEIVVAKVIEFYVPTKFPKPSKCAPDLHRGRVIEFSLTTTKSA